MPSECIVGYIQYGFEYLKEWIYEGRAWNEAYMLRAFLQYNNAFQIVFFTRFSSTSTKINSPGTCRSVSKTWAGESGSERLE